MSVADDPTAERDQEPQDPAPVTDEIPDDEPADADEAADFAEGHS